MSKLLFDSNPLIIIRELACKIGLNEAIVLQQVHYWVVNNKEKQRNFYDGRYWVYNSLTEWQENNFPFWSVDTVARAIKSLETKKILVSGNYNTDKRDRTKWYSIDYKLLDSVYNEPEEKEPEEQDEPEEEIDGECLNALPQNADMEGGVHFRKMHECINTETSLYTENTNQEQYIAKPQSPGLAKKIENLAKRVGVDTVNKDTVTNAQQKNDKCNDDSSKPEQIPPAVFEIFTHWNCKDIISHKSLSKEIQKEIEKALKKYSPADIKRYIDRYEKVLHDDSFFFSYKWTLGEFLKRSNGMSDFTDEGSKWTSYMARSQGESQKTEYQKNLEALMKL